MQDKSQLDLIISLFSNGKVQEVLNQIDPLIKDNPNDAVLFNIRGACYAHIGEPIMAMKQYEKAIEMDSNYSEAYNNLTHLSGDDPGCPRFQNLKVGLSNSLDN